MKVEAVGIGAYLENAKIKSTPPKFPKEIRSREIGSEIESLSHQKLKDGTEASPVKMELMEILSSEEKDFLEKLFGYERSIRSLNRDIKSYRGSRQNKSVLGTKVDLIA